MKTRKDIFLQQYPDANVEKIRPCEMEKSLAPPQYLDGGSHTICTACEHCEYSGSIACNVMKYWNEEVVVGDNEENNMKIKFVSYDGEYPNLCSGTLVLRVNSKLREFEHILYSGGNVSFGDDWCDAYVSYGEWTIKEEELQDDLLPYVSEITELVNENVPYGCCGGCI